MSPVSNRCSSGVVIVEHMNLRQLGYFVAVVDSGSFSRAAKRANVAQPALSEQIASLEDELGIRLLIRSQRGIEATAAGLMLYGRARSVLTAIDNIRDELKSDSEPSGEVVIGLPSALGAVLASPIVSAAVRRHPKLRVRIVEAPSYLQRQSLRRGELDLAIVFDDELLPALERRPLYTQQLFLVDQRDGRREASGVASLADLAGIPLLMPGRSTRESVVLALKSIGAEANVVAEANSTRTLLALVDAGVGAAIVPSWVADRGDLRWRRIAEPISPMTVSLYTVAGVPRSESVNAVIQLAERIILERVQLADWRGALAYMP